MNIDFFYKMKNKLKGKLFDLYENFSDSDYLQEKLKEMEEENPSNSTKNLSLYDLKKLHDRNNSYSVIPLKSRKSIYPSLKDKYDSYLKTIKDSSTNYIMRDQLSIALRKSLSLDKKKYLNSINKNLNIAFKDIKKEEHIKSDSFFYKVSRKVYKENKDKYDLKKSTGLKEIVNCLATFYKYEVKNYIDKVGFDEDLEYYIEGLYKKLNSDLYFTCSDDNVKKEINYELKETIHDYIGRYDDNNVKKEKIESELTEIIMDMYHSSNITP